MSQRAHRIYLLLLLLLLPWQAFSQEESYALVEGYVRSAKSHETLPGAIIAAIQSPYGTTTNSAGHYTLRIPKGEWVIQTSYTGLSTRLDTMNIVGDTVLDVLLAEEIEITQVTVIGSGGAESTQSSRTSTIEIPIRAINEVPMLLGERDALKVVQLMPGVQKGREGTSGLYVRGGGPDQNLIILDDAPLYNVHHLLGMFSVFNGNGIKRMELIKGGFPARYGGRLSSVLDVVMDDGNMREYHGHFGIGLVSAHADVEGPIVKEKASFKVTARRTYADALIAPFVTGDGVRPIMYFYDLTAKVNWQINSKHRIFLSGYFGEDRFGMRQRPDSDTESDMALYWGNATGTLRWNWTPRSDMFSKASLFYSYYAFNTKVSMKQGPISYLQRYMSGIQNLGLRWDFTWNVHPMHDLRMGLQTTGYLFTPQATTLKENIQNNNYNERVEVLSLETAVYAEDEMRPCDWLKANIGLRVANFTSKGLTRFTVEPRTSLAFLITEETSIKTSFAMTGQNLHLLVSTGLGLPSDLWVPATVTLPPETGWITALGWGYDWNKIGMRFSVEGYYKQSKGVTHYLEGASFLSFEQMITGKRYYWEDQITQGKSWSAGVEFLVQRKVGKLTGWIGYTLSWTRMQFDRINNGDPFWASYDRRHDISIVLMYALNDNWRFSGTWVYGTGNAFTLPMASYQIPVGPKMPSPFPQYITQYSGMNESRMEPYHRLDLGIQWIKPTKYVEWILALDIYNVYYRKNPFFYTLEGDSITTLADGKSYSRSKLMRVSLFPIIPTLSVQLKF